MASAVCLLLGLWAVAAGPEKPGAPALVEIGTYKLTLERFESYWESLPAVRRQAYEATGGKRAFLDDVVKQKLLALEAERLGLPGEQAVAARLELQRDAALAQALVEREVADKLVPEDALRAYHKEHASDFTEPESIEARHILVTPRADTRSSNSRGDDARTPEEARAKIERLQTELAAGADFGELATAWSEDVTAAQAGSLGSFSRGRMVKPFEDAAFALETGKTSAVVETVYGYHLIQVLARTPERVPRYEEVRERVRTLLRRQKSDEFEPRLESYVTELKATMPMTIHAELLDGAAAKPEDAPKPAAR